MGPGMAIRYDRPADAIADSITGYHLYAAHGPQVMGQKDWFLPGTANVRITLDAGPVAVRIGNRNFDPLPQVALFGPTSRVMEAVTNGGVMIGFGINALGWARLFRRSAQDVHNRIVPLESIAGEALSRRLIRELSAAPDEHAIKPILDGILAPLLGPMPDDADIIRDLMALVVDRDMAGIVQLADTMGVPSSKLRRIAHRYFGMTPKLLIRRTRFLRAFLAMFRNGDAADYAAIEDGYFDASHFLRDANSFLGTTPRRFMARDTPFLNASVRARAAVLGTPTQALHVIGGSASAARE
jgi:AraC-like DNA-binding protein